MTTSMAARATHEAPLGNHKPVATDGSPPEPSALSGHEIEEARRALGGWASAFEFRAIRSRGWMVDNGWIAMPEEPNLPVVDPYRLRNENAKICVSEPARCASATYVVS